MITYMAPAPRPNEFNELELLNPQLLFLPKIHATFVDGNRNNIPRLRHCGRLRSQQQACVPPFYIQADSS